MATLDDKLMGEKLHYYCSSSSEDEGDEPEETGGPAQPPPPPPPNGQQANTGPKGVIEDWRRFKQLETEKRQENERERLALAKRLALTCRSEREDKEVEQEMEKLELDDEDDEFLKEYMKKRMQEMVEASVMNKKHFGRVFTLSDGEQFLAAVDHPDHKNVITIIHIWEQGNEACKTIDQSFQDIAKDYSHIKFCRIQASSTAVLSKDFKASGVPAILVYRNGDLIHSFVRITDTLGDDFYASDLESFLIENGIMSDARLMPSIIKGPTAHAGDHESDSD